MGGTLVHSNFWNRNIPMVLEEIEMIHEVIAMTVKG